ncbi:HNH endonuclease [Ralstonia solanacearum]|uniref:HNH endonuclease n=1 Tax=Ralstonia solanacearum TaxID=305 RepID=UPI0018D1DC32|nr:HNH endonuclease [Ralstonia solanacearum]
MSSFVPEKLTGLRLKTPVEFVNAMPTLTNAIANSRNGFNDSHFGGDPQRWLTVFARDPTNSILVVSCSTSRDVSLTSEREMTDSKKCALCSDTLSAKNKTKEHVIPNAIGGRKKTTEFICNDCNNKLGRSWDADLARQLNWFSLAVGISRERGESPRQVVQTIAGDKYWLLNDGSLTPEKSSYLEEDLGGKIKISLTAKTVEEAKQRLKGIARKYPKFDIEKAMSELEVATNYLDSPLHVSLSLGGANAGRSLVKTAFAFASECGVPHSQCEKALEYLINPEAEAIPFGFAYLSDLVEGRPKDRIFHCVSLHGDSKKKRLWSYIEYFGIFRIVVLLSDQYGGPDRNEIYTIDPISGERVAAKVRSQVSEEEFSSLMKGNGFDQEKHKAAADYALPIILDRSRSRSLERSVKEGFDHAAKQLGIKENEIIPKEKAAKFTGLMMEKISPFIEHLVRNGRRNGRS